MCIRVTVRTCPGAHGGVCATVGRPACNACAISFTSIHVLVASCFGCRVVTRARHPWKDFASHAAPAVSQRPRRRPFLPRRWLLWPFPLCPFVDFLPPVGIEKRARAQPLDRPGLRSRFSPRRVTRSQRVLRPGARLLIWSVTQRCPVSATFRSDRSLEGLT